MVFEFFFQLTAGIALGLAIVILPAIYIYNRYIGNPRRGRS